MVSLRRRLAGRSGLPLLLGLPVLLAGCTSIAGPTTTFGDIFWSFVAFFFWFMAIWIFITIFGDIFRRNDLTGGMKAVWIIALCILPFLGAIIYMVARDQFSGINPQYWYFWIGTLLVAVVILLPNGILGGLARLKPFARRSA